MFNPHVPETQRDSAQPSTNGRTVAPRARHRQPAEIAQRSIGNRAVLKLRSQSPIRIQRQLAMGRIDDPLEHEADAVAERVMAMTQADVTRQGDTGTGQRTCSAAVAAEDRRLRRKATGEARGDAAISGAVHETLATAGRPLDAQTRGFFEPRFGRDFGDVRIHHDSLADASARSVSALAYTAGNHVVFRRGAFSPETAGGKRLLAHELTHVTQQVGQIQRQAVPAPAQSLPPEALVSRDPLGEALGRIARIARSTTIEAQVAAIEAAVAGIDLGSRPNLHAVIRAISSTFGADSGPVLTLFLTRLEQAQGPRRPTPEDIARMDRTIGMMAVQPRGPYRQYGPGVLLPVVSQVARPLLPLAEAMENFDAGAGSFIAGMIEGLSGSLNEMQRAQLQTRLSQSQLLSALFPEIFAAGAAVGVVEDVVDAVKGVYHVLGNLGEFLQGMAQLVGAMFSDESSAIGRAVGREMGRSFGARLGTMAEENVFRFTFDLGRLIGPTIVYIVLAFVGAPEVVASAMVMRLLPVLRPLLLRFPALLEMAEAAALWLRERSAGTILGRAMEARRLALAAPALARIRVAIRAGAFVTRTFERALAENLATEGVGLARVMAAVPDRGFARLYGIAYDGLNNPEIWESVLADIAREAQAVRPPFANAEVTSRSTQAIWNLSERAAGPGGRIAVLPRGNLPQNFIEYAPWGPRFYDVNIGRGHGMSSHLVQDLVVDRALQRAGVSMSAEQFRAAMGAVPGQMPGMSTPLRQLLWEALYDGTEGRLTSPEGTIALLRAALEAGVD